MNCSRLSAVKFLHTAVWCFFVGCILGIWVAGSQKHFETAMILSGIVLGECAILATNRGRCPLTDVAARYTDDRRPNFDIYLPEWLARYNKWIFGIIFAAAEVYLILRVGVSAPR